MTHVDSLQYWMMQLANRAQKTKTNYRLYFRKFALWMGKTPDELITMQQHRNSDPDPRVNRVLEGKVRSYLAHLEKEGKSVSTRKVAFNAINSFFKSNLHPLDLGPNDRPNGQAQGSRIPEKHEIVQLLNAAKTRRIRAAILFLKDSGLRISDVVRLTWSDRTDYGEGFWGWTLQTQKRRIVASPFVGPETVAALKQLSNKNQRVFPMTAGTLTVSLSHVVRATDVKGVSAHGLRKYFNVELQAARVPREWRFRMMGKATGAYDETRLSKLFSAYRDAYDHLRVYGSSTRDVEKLKDAMEVLREENRSLRAKVNGYNSEFDKITEDLRRINLAMEIITEEMNRVKQKVER
jgi:integrase